MSHWSEKYIGQKWTEDHDCYWWFREIQKNEFGVDVPVVSAGHDRSFQIASKLLTDQHTRECGWLPTAAPKEGDAVYMSKSRKFNTHIGIVFFSKGKLFIIHALRGIGVVASDEQGLKINGLYQKGYWTHANTIQ